MWVWDPDLGPHACTLGMLQIEPSPQVPFYSFENEQTYYSFFISIAHPPKAPEIKLAVAP